MTDAAAIEPAVHAEEDKVLPAVVYGLYLLGCANGLTVIVGLIVAYVNRDTAGPINQSHYTFAIRTFWLGIAWFLIGGLLMLFGIPMLVVLVGLPMIIAGGLILGAVGLWFVVRCVLGVYHLVRGEAYPRPRAWLI
jgi:uncharacterized membrane protein